MASRLAQQLKGRYDIIINGGGIVGFTLLNLILKSPFLKQTSVLLIDHANRPTSFVQKPHNQDQNGDKQNGSGFSNRVSSITLASKAALQSCDVWDRVRPFANDVKVIKVWSYDYAHAISFEQCLSKQQRSLRLSDNDVVFSTVENNRLSSALLESIHDNPDSPKCIAWQGSLTGLGASVEDGIIDVALEDKRTGETCTTSASLVLGCDGSESKVRELSRIRMREFELKKRAVVGTVEMCSQYDSPQNDVAYQKFSAERDTVAALLPLDKRFCSFVISAPEDYARSLMEVDDEVFLKHFNQLLGAKELASNVLLRGLHAVVNATFDNMRSLCQITPAFGLGSTSPSCKFDDDIDQLAEPPSLARVVANSRASFPLTFSTTSPRMTGSLSGPDQLQVALLGDSAHRVHPLAGQGLNLGIQDAAELVRQLESYARIGERIFGDSSLLTAALRKYELRRQAYIVPMSASILAMQDLFRVAPSRVLSTINQCDFIKRVSVRTANGI